MGQEQWGKCGLCHATKNVAYNSVVDDDVCSACYRRELQPRFPCSRCGKIATTAARPDGVHGYCNRCYLKEIHLGRCSICKLRKSIAVRIRGGAVCFGCYRRKIQAREPCCRCGTVAIVQMRVDGSKPVCERCYVAGLRPRVRCSKC